MKLVLIILGGFVGLSVGDASPEFLGLVAGAAIGYLLAQVGELRERLRKLDLQRDIDAPIAPIKVDPDRSARREPGDQPPPAAAEPAATVPAAPEQTRRRSGFTAPDEPAPATPRAGTLAKLLELAKAWLSTGNVPVKLGVIVSFFGVAFLLKYAVDRQLVVVPIGVRYLLVAAAAVALLILGWRLRARDRVYALSLLGAGCGILYLTVFAAFRLHPLIPPAAAFVLLVMLTALTGALAVLQNARALAVFGTVGGFLAPVLISTGSGNHVALFSYYLLLNAAILGIAWYRAWRELNVIGFAFTFGVGTMWGYEYYRPGLFASTEPFLVAHFLFYQAIAVLFAFRQPPRLRGVVDGTLVFGTPVIAFALQSELVENTAYGLAISALVVAGFYAVVATWLHRSQGRQMRMLVESFGALGVAFATIAIPLALDDRWTAVAWSLEGAALVWVGVRQRGVLARLSGAALLLASGAAYLAYGWRHGAGMPLLNGNFLGGVLISVSSLVSARYLAADGHPMRWQPFASTAILIWGLCWWLGTGAMEIADRAPGDSDLHLLTAFVASSAGLLAMVARRYGWHAARNSTLAYLPLLPVMALLYLWEHDHVLAGWGALSWALAALAHFGLLRAFDNGRQGIESYWHFAGALLVVAVVAYEVFWRLDARALSFVWAGGAALLVPVLGAFVVLTLREWLAWPLQRHWNAYAAAAAVLTAAQLLLVGAVGIDDPGNPAPLPYIPVLNPLDAVTLAGLAMALRTLSTTATTGNWRDGDKYRIALTVWGGAAFVLSTIAVVRGVHHFGAVAWQERALANSVLVQSSLSIYWAMLGFAGMIFGARHAKRWLWIAGTALMALVVVKLFAVDLGNSGTVARIVSFLGVGALLLVVGYFAPAPPRQPAAPGTAPQE